MRRNIILFAFFGLLAFSFLPTFADAQTLKPDKYNFGTLIINDNHSNNGTGILINGNEILSVTLPTATTPTKWKIVYQPEGLNPSTIVTTCPVWLSYSPK